MEEAKHEHEVSYDDVALLLDKEIYDDESEFSNVKQDLQQKLKSSSHDCSRSNSQGSLLVNSRGSVIERNKIKSHDVRPSPGFDNSITIEKLKEHT